MLKRSNEGRGKVITDIKGPKRFNEKVEKDGKDPGELKDVLRGSIILNNDDDLEQVVRNILKHAVVNSVDHKRDPDPKKGYYHGPWHIDIEVGSGDARIIAEVIIMTGRAGSAKKVAHPYYEDIRSKDPERQRQREEAIQASRELWDFGAKPKPKPRKRTPRRERKVDLTGI